MQPVNFSLVNPESLKILKAILTLDVSLTLLIENLLLTLLMFAQFLNVIMISDEWFQVLFNISSKTLKKL